MATPGPTPRRSAGQTLMELGSRVALKAETDPEFRALALRDGKAAVEQVACTHLPDGLKIHFVEGHGAEITWGLRPVNKSGELSDRELEAVAGGRSSEETASTSTETAADTALDVAASIGECIR